MSLIITHARVEGRDPRDVPERRAARPARLVRDRRRAEAARLFFGKDVSNLTLAEAATIAGVIQSPSALSPFNNPARCTRAPQRRAAGDGRRRLHHAGRRRPRASQEPLVVVQRALEAEAPYFVDYVGQTLAEQYPGLTTTTTQAGGRLHDARSAPAAPGAGRGARRPDAASTSCWRGASARARPRRR